MENKIEFENVGLTFNVPFVGSQTGSLIVAAFLPKKHFDNNEYLDGEMKKAVQIINKYRNTPNLTFQEVFFQVRTGFNIGISNFSFNKNFILSESGELIPYNADQT
jgi:hypothetical protein